MDPFVMKVLQAAPCLFPPSGFLCLTRISKQNVLGKKNKTQAGKGVNEQRQEEPDLQVVCTAGSFCSTQRY